MLFQINSDYESEFFKIGFRDCYCDRHAEEFVTNESLLRHIPFTFAKFENFVQFKQEMAETMDTKQLVQSVEEEAEKLPFLRRGNDLFAFYQSCDVINLCSNEKNSSNTSKFPLLVSFRTFLLNCVLPWLKDITGIPLYENKVDLTSSLYKHGDYLLCHDDKLEGRRVAFIWYLVPDSWDSQIDGGELQLYESQPITDDNSGENFFPTQISTTIPPKRNMFMFFEVSPRSFHQVAEVFGYSKRLSLHGWFHGPSLWTVDNNIMPSIEKISPIHIEEELVYQWINPIYFDTEQLSKIRRRFCRSSEIQLTNFIKTDKWIELVQCIKGISAQNWLHCGPPNRRNYHCLFNTNSNTIPDLCDQIIRLFKSEAMLVILSDITGIQLHPCSIINSIQNTTVVNDNNITNENAPQSKRMRTEDIDNVTSPSDTDLDCLTHLTEPCLRKLQPGSYTLLSDADMTDQGWRLECLLHIHGYGLKYHNNKKTQLQGINSQSNSSFSGQTVYVADGEEDELLTVTPSDNALTLVYAGPGTASFLKYINHTTNDFPSDKNQINKQADCNSLITADKLSYSKADHMNKDLIQLFDLSIKYFESKSGPEDVNSLQSDNNDEVSSISSLSEKESIISSSQNGDTDLQNDEDDEVDEIK
ncbi:unnamed protein product [Schistosoma rodhaini]|uniref:Prolyl 4-hydroxylase alpha subunit domain-containing protein n=1 Tax=Schistosoma rodhaini TaxID=6188 RepID=A0AA85GA24_9TREM|nr:unnamed protein product [Schistosoma rodhaini]